MVRPWILNSKPFINYVNLGKKMLNLSDYKFSHLCNGENNKINFIGL